jgi:flagellar basal-body rod protein FlgG
LAPSASDPQISTSSVAPPILSGVTIAGTPHIWTQGDLQQTGHPLDVAVQGEGFIELLGPSGSSLLWRGGTLKVNEDGYLAAADGTPLKAMISVPLDASSLTIARDGVVSAIVGGDTVSHELGQIDLVMVKDTDGLTDVGDGYYDVADAANTYPVTPGEEGGPTLAQGALESSNVKLTDEMTAMLLVQRAFAANAQIVQAGDQLMSIVNGLRR